jgi:hypothetical protein
MEKQPILVSTAFYIAAYKLVESRERFELPERERERERERDAHIGIELPDEA